MRWTSLPTVSYLMSPVRWKLKHCPGAVSLRFSGGPILSSSTGGIFQTLFQRV